MTNGMVKVVQPIWKNLPPPRTLDHKQIHIWRGFLGEHRGNIRRLLESLSDGEKKRAGRYVMPLDRDKFIVYHGLLRHLLSYYTGCQPKALVFGYNRFGKPYLKHDSYDTGLRFNMSDSQDMNLIAIGQGITVGVDVEAIRKLENGIGLARDIFNEKEVAFIEGMGPNAFYDGFFICWTRKEAIIKAIGKGLSIPLKEFSTIPDYHLVQADAVCPEENQDDWAIRSFQPANGFYGALATKGRVIKIEFYELSGLNTGK